MKMASAEVASNDNKNVLEMGYQTTLVSLDVFSKFVLDTSIENHNHNIEVITLMADILYCVC